MTLHLPDYCPPDGHQPADGRYYRLSRGDLQVGDKPTPADWTPPVMNKRSAVYQDFDRCDAYSHSIFDNIDVLLGARQLVPWARKKSIAMLDLEASMGRVLSTQSELGEGHYDWWANPLDLYPDAVVVEARSSDA